MTKITDFSRQICFSDNILQRSLALHTQDGLDCQKDTFNEETSKPQH